MDHVLKKMQVWIFRVKFWNFHGVIISLLVKYVLGSEATACTASATNMIKPFVLNRFSLLITAAEEQINNEVENEIMLSH